MANRPAYISLDMGTTAVKVSIVGMDGTVECTSTQEYELHTPREGVVEIDPEVYWSCCRDGIRHVLKKCSQTPISIRSIGVSSQAETLIAVDQSGKPLRNAIVWLDNRSYEEANEIRTKLGLDRSTGQAEVLPTWPATKILWLRKSEPQVFQKTHKFLLVEDFILLKLTGEYRGEYSLYSSSYLLDIVKKRWQDEILDFIGISDSQLVDLGESGEIVGRVRPSVSEDLGVPSDTQVVSGALDLVAALVGAGNIKEGLTTETTGGALAVCTTLEEFPKSPHPLLPVHYHAAVDKYLSLGWCPTAGMSLKWLRNVVFGGIESFESMDALAAEVPAGAQSLLFFPYMSGPGTLPVGEKIRGVFYGLELHHNRAHLVRAVLEAIAYAVREIVEMAASTGDENVLFSVGGGATSSVWNQIKADVTQREVRTLRNQEAASVGTAILQAVALGHNSCLEEAVRNMVQDADHYEPDMSKSNNYDQLYQKYMSIRDNLVRSTGDVRPRNE